VAIGLATAGRHANTNGGLGSLGIHAAGRRARWAGRNALRNLTVCSANCTRAWGFERGKLRKAKKSEVSRWLTVSELTVKAAEIGRNRTSWRADVSDPERESA